MNKSEGDGYVVKTGVQVRGGFELYAFVGDGTSSRSCWSSSEDGDGWSQQSFTCRLVRHLRA